MISILTVTYNRPQWMPWLEYQVQKQVDVADYEHIVVGVNPEIPNWHRLQFSRRTIASVTEPSIPAQRNLALSLARGTRIVWFDDDDWQSPTRLQRSLESDCIVANRWSYCIDAHNPSRCHRNGYEPFLFNSACVPEQTRAWPRFDQNLPVDEDIDWIHRLGDVRYQILPEPLFCWMSHDQNVTNARTGRLFEERTPVMLDATERDLLRRALGGS